MIFSHGAAAVKIRGYVASRKVDFRTTITFTAQPENAPANVEFYWYVNGERQGDNQQSITLGEVRDDFEIQVLMRTADNDIFVYSEKEKVNYASTPMFMVKAEKFIKE